jgi:hypothetical protein
MVDGLPFLRRKLHMCVFVGQGLGPLWRSVNEEPRQGRSIMKSLFNPWLMAMALSAATLFGGGWKGCEHPKPVAFASPQPAQDTNRKAGCSICRHEPQRPRLLPAPPDRPREEYYAPTAAGRRAYNHALAAYRIAIAEWNAEKAIQDARAEAYVAWIRHCDNHN